MPARQPVAPTVNQTIIDAAAGRWGEIAAEVVSVEPYVVTEALVISPLTRRRRKSLRAAQTAYMLAAGKLAEVMADVGGDSQSVSEERQPDGTLVRTIVRRESTTTADEEMVARIEKLVDDADYVYNKALFGDVCDEVLEYFEDQADEKWDAFYEDVHNKLVHRIQPPVDACTKCGRKFDDDSTESGPDEVGEGKGPSSSTSSSGIGTKSKGTSAAS